MALEPFVLFFNKENAEHKKFPFIRVISKVNSLDISAYPALCSVIYRHKAHSCYVNVQMHEGKKLMQVREDTHFTQKQNCWHSSK